MREFIGSLSQERADSGHKAAPLGHRRQTPDVVVCVVRLVKGGLDLGIRRLSESLKMPSGRWVITLELALRRHDVVVLEEGGDAAAVVGVLSMCGLRS